MVAQTFPTTLDYTNRIASIERQIESLERRRIRILEHISTYKRPANMALALFAPIHRRSTMSEILHLRREVESLDQHIQDLKSDQEAVSDEMRKHASIIDENTRLCEQEESLQRERRWLTLREDTLELKRRKAAFEKAQERDRLHDEALELQRQQTELQEQLEAVREKLSENRQRCEQMDKRLPAAIVFPSDIQTHGKHEDIEKVSG